MKEKIRKYSLLYLALFIYSFVSVFAKIASRQGSIFKTVFFMGIELCLLGIYALLWQQVLKQFPLIVAMSNKGVTVIIALVWAALLFKESITVWNVIGALVIIMGIWMVSSDD